MSAGVVLVPHPHVRVDKSAFGGSPYIAGHRLPVYRLYSFFKSGATVERILRRYPQLGPAKVLDALAFAFDNLDLIEADLARADEVARSHRRPE